MKDEAPSPGAPVDAPKGSSSLANAIGARNLFIIIVTMPLVFLAFVMGAIFFLGPPGGGAKDQHAQAPAAIVLPAGGEIAAMSLDGDRLAIRVKTETDGEIVIYDLARGAVMTRVPIVQETEDP